MPAVRLKPLSEQVIVITGASSGIGLATARAAAKAGAKVVMTARNLDALTATKAEPEVKGSAVEIIAVDIAEADAAERIAAAAIARFGGFDTSVNNAASAPISRVADTSVDDQRRVFDVGYWETVRGSLAALAHSGHAAAAH